jgi:hypothetical protein
MLALLATLSNSYFCKQTITIVKSTPETFEGPLGDGDRLCINSTLPFLAVAFQQTTFLKVRYYSIEPSSGKVKTGQHFYIPSETAAVGFGSTIAHLEVQALIPGTVSLSTFAFPSECEHSRYLTTVIDDSFHLANRLSIGQFADTVSSAACIWSPHPQTAFLGPLTEDSRDAVQVCGDSGCRTAWQNGTTEERRVVEFTATEYLKIEANRPDFVGDYQAEISVKKEANFLGAYGRFDPDSAVDTVQLTSRADGDNHPDLKDEVQPPPPPPAEAPVVAPARIPRPPLQGQRRGGLRTVISVLQIVCLTVVSVGAIVCIVTVVANKSGRDDAEAGLLGGVRGDARGPLSRFSGILPYAVPWGAVPQYGGLYQPPAGFAYPQPSGGVGFPAAQFPQTPEGPPAPQAQQPANP